jgi:gamma-glutamyltranspeptidase/glutathione hydrolase
MKCIHKMTHGSGLKLGIIAAMLAASGAQAASYRLNAAAVAVPDAYAAEAAKQIFKAGGNAVDAAVAVAFALEVTYPEAGNIGGGGFMTVYINGKPYFLDYRERAPLAATSKMYLDAQGNVIDNLSWVGAKAVGVPGTVMGMWEAQHRFGKLSWKQDMAPALRLAHNGYVVSQLLIDRRDEELNGDFKGNDNNFRQYFGDLKAGQLLKQPVLEATLKRIAAQGPRDFYQGKTADLLVSKMQQSGGLITRDDLKQYKAVWRTPVMTDWNGYRVITAPPPSSGGIALVQLLKMKADRAQDFSGVALNSAKYIHLLAEIEKRVFADRAEYLGDPDFYHVPIDKLTSDAYIAKRAAEVNPDKPSLLADVKPGLPESHETTHFSIVDKWGNAVSNTYTLNNWYGSGVVVDGGGFLLNDEMDDFASKPGVPNMFGVVGKDVNAIAPKKRMLSSMSPTILTKNGKVSLVIGTPGGSRIFTSVFQVICNLYDFNLPLHDAVAQMRVHHQLLPENTLFSEPYMPLSGPVKDELVAMGYKMKTQDFSGDIQAIQIVGRDPVAAADPRGRGVAVTFQ